MDDWLVSVVKDGKVQELYFSHDLADMGAIRAMNPGCSFEKCHVGTEKTEQQEEFVPSGKKRRGRPSSKSWANPVLCVETGETWPTIIECSKVTGIPQWTLYKSVHNGNAVGGLHYKVVKN